MVKPYDYPARKLASAVHLRETEKHQAARQLLLELHNEFPNDPQVNYGSLPPCAWIYNPLGLEREAIPFYEKAIQMGLTGDDQKSIDTFQHALTLFPNSHEFNVFLAMAYYNMGEHGKAMELWSNSLVNPAKDEGVLRYQRAIRFYSDKLNQTW